MPEDIIIIGAGGQSLDIVDLITEINSQSLRYRLRGFLDDNPALKENEIAGVKVLGPLSKAAQMPEVKLVNGVLSRANLTLRPQITITCGSIASRWPSLIHPSAVVSPSAKVANGVVVLAQAVVCANARLEFGATLLPHAVVSHQAVVEEHAVLATGAVMSGHSRAGRLAYLGAGCRIREEIELGEGSVIGMGAVVVKNVPAGEVVAGNPAKILPKS